MHSRPSASVKIGAVTLHPDAPAVVQRGFVKGVHQVRLVARNQLGVREVRYCHVPGNHSSSARAACYIARLSVYAPEQSKGDGEQ